MQQIACSRKNIYRYMILTITCAFPSSMLPKWCGRFSYRCMLKYLYEHSFLNFIIGKYDVFGKVTDPLWAKTCLHREMLLPSKYDMNNYLFISLIVKCYYQAIVMLAITCSFPSSGNVTPKPMWFEQLPVHFPHRGMSPPDWCPCSLSVSSSPPQCQTGASE